MRNRQKSWGKLGKEHLLLHWETFITIHRWNRGSPSLATLPKITTLVSGGFSVKTEIRLVQWPIHHPNKMFEFLRDRATFQCLLFLHLVVLTLGQCHPPSGHLEKSGSTFGTPVKGVGCALAFSSPEVRHAAMLKTLPLHKVSPIRKCKSFPVEHYTLNEVHEVEVVKWTPSGIESA